MRGEWYAWEWLETNVAPSDHLAQVYVDFYAGREAEADVKTTVEADGSSLVSQLEYL